MKNTSFSSLLFHQQLEKYIDLLQQQEPYLVVHDYLVQALGVHLEKDHIERLCSGKLAPNLLVVDAFTNLLKAYPEIADESDVKTFKVAGRTSVERAVRTGALRMGEDKQPASMRPVAEWRKSNPAGRENEPSLQEMLEEAYRHISRTCRCRAILSCGIGTFGGHRGLWGIRSCCLFRNCG